MKEKGEGKREREIRREDTEERLISPLPVQYSRNIREHVHKEGRPVLHACLIHREISFSPVKSDN